METSISKMFVTPSNEAELESFFDKVKNDISFAIGHSILSWYEGVGGDFQNLRVFISGKVSKDFEWRTPSIYESPPHGYTGDLERCFDFIEQTFIDHHTPLSLYATVVINAD